MNLTETKIRKLVSTNTQGTYSDGRALYLRVGATTAIWRMEYKTVSGARRKYVLGEWPLISLDDARLRLLEVKQEVREGADPANTDREFAQAAARTELNLTIRKNEKLGSVVVPAAESFSRLTEQFTARQLDDGRAEKTLARNATLLRYLTDAFGQRRPDSITSDEVLEMLLPISNLGKRETAKRVLQIMSRVLRFGKITKWGTEDVTTGLNMALPKNVVRHRPAFIEPKDVAGMMRSINSYRGQPETRLLMLFTAHTFQRPGECRQVTFEQIDFDACEWTIPKDVMKTRAGDHRVPLSTQAMQILNEAKRFTDPTGLCFPSMKYRDRMISDAAVNKALELMGFGRGDTAKHCAHGFRTTASTNLREIGKFDDHLIETQLSHVDTNAVRAAYNRAQYMDERRPMMQWYSDWLDTIVLE